ncbi:MAG: TRAFs-binding domain-containing protein [Pyrinomonadaceae bacterium]
MDEKKTCFVAIGFGPKTDYETGRLLDLDKTFENLIKPVFDELGIECFRAKEKKHSGIIDVPMYQWLFNADIVVADISTLNPNAIYELGVRHALKPYSTIVISENKMKYPFDLNHISISSYEHLGSDIGFSEVMRFRGELKKLVETILEKTEEEREDSPVYTFLKGLTPPIFGDKVKMPEVAEMKKDDRQFSDWIERAEKAKNEKKYLIAAEYFSECLEFEPHNVFLKQRLALVTYKAGEGKDKTKEETKAALEAAEKILADLKPEETTDPETLGLSGAINKRLHEVTGEEKYLDKAMWFYERGFYVKQDYYNGINFAYLLNVKASTIEDKYEAISFYLQAKRVREKVIGFCENLINQPDFDKRGDSEWVYQTMAQAFLGLGRKDEVEKLVPKIEELSKGAFDLDTFYNQNEKLTEYLGNFKAKHDYP